MDCFFFVGSFLALPYHHSGLLSLSYP
jgi:hypothetical protein